RLEASVDVLCGPIFGGGGRCPAVIRSAGAAGAVGRRHRCGRTRPGEAGQRDHQAVAHPSSGASATCWPELCATCSSDVPWLPEAAILLSEADNHSKNSLNCSPANGTGLRWVLTRPSCW